MISTKPSSRGPTAAPGSPRPGANHPILLALVLIFAALTVSHAAAQPSEVFVRLTAVDEDGSVSLGDLTEANVGDSQLAIFDEQEPEWLPIRVRGPENRDRALFHIGEVRSSLLLSSLGVDLQLRRDGGLAATLRLADERAGWLDVYHDVATPLLTIAIPGGTVGLGKGAARLRQLPDGAVEITVMAGAAAVTSDGDADNNVAAAEVVLKAAENNSVVVQSDGALSEPRRVEGIATVMSSERSAVVQRSLLPEMVDVAEAVAEGDIEPPTRGARTMVAVVFEVRIAEIVPRGSLVSQVIAGVQTVVQATAPSTAEAFIGSQSAALAVVGARLERTRIAGSSGTAARAPLTINTQLRRPFTLGR